MNLRRPLLLTTFSLLFIAGCSQNDILTSATPNLNAQFGSTGNDRADAVVTAPSQSRIYLAGAYNVNLSTGLGDRLFFRSYDRTGHLIWERLQGRAAYVTGAAADSDGNALFSWRTNKSFVTKYNLAGTKLFQLVLRDFDVTGLTTDRYRNIYVAGTYGSKSPPPLVRKYNRAGKLVWEKRVVVGTEDDGVGPPMLGIADLTATPDGSLYLAGQSVDDYGYLVKLRGSDGAILGQKQLFGSGIEIEASSNQAIYLRAAYEDVLAGDSDYLVYKFRSDLNTVWSRRDLIPTDDGGASRGNDDDSYGLGTDTQGNVYLTGVYVTDATYDTDYFVRKYSASGNLIFDRRSVVPQTSAVGSGIAALSPNELYLIGSTEGKVNGKNYGGQDAFLIKTDRQGRTIWSR